MKKVLYYIIVLVFSINIIVNTISIINIKKESTDNPQKELTVETVQTKTSYIVKSDENQVYVYETGKTAPIKCLNINLKGLRKYDVEQLKKGINFKSLQEISEFEEDFSG